MIDQQHLRRTTLGESACSHDLTVDMPEFVTSATASWSPPCEDCEADLPYGALSEVRRRLEYDDGDTIAHEDIDWDEVLNDE